MVHKYIYIYEEVVSTYVHCTQMYTLQTTYSSAAAAIVQ